MLQDILAKWGAYEVTPMECYTDVFKLGQGYIQRSDESPGQFKANPVAYYRNKNRKSGHFRILFEDTFEETLKLLQRASECAFMNGITYFGRKYVQEHASKMFAMIFDLDGVTDVSLDAFLSGAIRANAYPVPNYLILSGHGVHLYYLFEEPISLFPYTKLQLKDLKYALTYKMWNPYTSTEEKPQQQGIGQPFRVIGSVTKEGAPEPFARAFKLNETPFTLDHLCGYVELQNRVDQDKLWKESKYTLSQAKKKFPDWYEKVIVNGDKSRKYWDLSEKVNGDNPYAIYDWWMAKIRAGATYRHRYFAIMCLAIYGAKCRKPYEEVEADALGLVPFLNDINPQEPFTEEDCRTALECYDLQYCTFPIKDIEKISGIPIERNRRNGRKQEIHLGRIRAMQQYDDPDGTWRNKEGRPLGAGTAKEKVAAYRAEHPEETVTDVARALGISRTTVYKWWSGEPAPAKPKTTRKKAQPAKIDGITQEQAETFAEQLVGAIMALPPEEREKLLEELSKKG